MLRLHLVVSLKVMEAIQPHERFHGLIACAIAFVALAACSNCSRQRDNVIVYEIPEGYRGYFWIIEDRKNGKPLKTTTTSSSKKTVFRIPKNGVLRIRDDTPLTSWHQSRARNYSGKKVPRRNPGDSQVAVQLLGTSSEGVHYHFVGPPKDFDSGKKIFEAKKKLEKRIRSDTQTNSTSQ